MISLSGPERGSERGGTGGCGVGAMFLPVLLLDDGPPPHDSKPILSDLLCRLRRIVHWSPSKPFDRGDGVEQRNDVRVDSHRVFFFFLANAT